MADNNLNQNTNASNQGTQNAPMTKGEMKKTEKEIEKSSASMLDFVAPSSFQITSDHLQINDLFVKTLFVYSYPRFLNTNWLSPVINYDISMDVGIHIAPLESDIFLDRLHKQAGRLESSRQIEQEKGLVRNPQLDSAISDVDQLRDDLSSGQQRIFKIGMYFTLYAKKPEEFKQAADQLTSLLGGLLVYTKQSIFQMEQGFHSTLPLAEDELQITKNLDTNSLSTTFPFVSAELTSNKGILYGVNRHNNSLILFDRFDLENANEVVFAKSGAGKSYAVKLEALRYLMIGTDVIVIDPENEYQALCEAVGGSFFDFSLNSDKRINPFDLPKGTGYEDGGTIIRTAVTDIKGLVSLMVGGITPEEDAVLDKAIYDTYALRDITEDISTHQNTPPLLSDLQGVLQNTTGAESLVRRLTKYTEGTFAGLFNRPTNFELQRGFIAFSIRNLEEALRPLAMYMILNYIWSQVRNKMRQRMLIVDEAWILMQYPDSARYLYSLAKRARKYYLGLTIISQDVEDFLSNEQGRAILNNSSLQLLLKQSPAAVEKLGEVFHLTEGEKFLLLESDVGEGLFFAGASHVAIKIVASYTEDQIITTDPRQLLAQQEQDEAQAPQGEPISQERSAQQFPSQNQQTADVAQDARGATKPAAPAQIQTNPQPVGNAINVQAPEITSNIIAGSENANPMGSGAPSAVATNPAVKATQQNATATPPQNNQISG
ncbi:MAG: AAA-like domain protein [candidate division WS2 bacterium ADurb.Bin280]|uniref:AAA-like domain protein n=1 Tax=candidate division WS2 bacterium ADurb.Bin280 TaxID=1852829 RepID=A0A1V5SC87_9BACT|nr:MAG: AAA-like domain protein [candidate division WS2 bacterium ADurb.Bin280]